MREKKSQLFFLQYPYITVQKKLIVSLFLKIFLNKLYVLPNNFAFLSVRTVELNMGESKLTASLNDSITNSEFETFYFYFQDF